MGEAPLTTPSLQRGWEIFSSRPLSLVFAFIVAVVICVVSLFLLTFPVIAGYGYAVRQSRREKYFIDINAMLRTTALLFRGIKIYFGQSYVFGFLGILPTAILFFITVLPILTSTNQKALILSLALEILWVPAFFLAGAFVFFGYPYLIATNQGKDAIRYALSVGKSEPLATTGKGFLLLFPLPGWIIHFLMIISYPILASWAIAATDDPANAQQEVFGQGQATFAKLILGLILAAVMVFVLHFSVAWWGGIGFFIGLGISFILAFVFASKVLK
jgi:hypothetical protein